MKGGKKARARGFSIVETLVVLAVTGGLFVAIAVTLSGKQARTEFEQSINEIRSQIQQTINEVAVGFYPDSATFTCSATLSGPSFASGSTGQGENTGCIFLGKAIQFKVGTTTTPEEFKIYTIAGLQRTAAGNEPITYAESIPKAVSPSTSDPSTPDATDTKHLLYGLTSVSATAGASNIGTVAFLNKLSPNASTIVSGAQQVNFVPVTGSSRGVGQQQAAETINTNLATSPINPAGGAQICFASGGSNQSGLIRIGGNARQLSVTLSIVYNLTCAGA